MSKISKFAGRTKVRTAYSGDYLKVSHNKQFERVKGWICHFLAEESNVCLNKLLFCFQYLLGRPYQNRFWGIWMWSGPSNGPWHDAKIFLYKKTWNIIDPAVPLSDKLKAWDPTWTGSKVFGYGLVHPNASHENSWCLWRMKGGLVIF